MASNTTNSAVADEHEPCFSISQTEAMVGISEFMLRIWEHRYRWPIPGRARNGYRRYTPHQVAVLKAVRKLLDGGLSIGEIVANPDFGLRDGRIPDVQPPRPRPARREIDFSRIPLPTSDAGRRLRRTLEDALQSNDLRTIERVTMEGSRLHPAERALAISQLIEFARPA